MRINFKISEFNISGEDIPEHIADAILEHHIQPMQVVRNELGYSMTASLKSGYRSPKWEKSRKRNGQSQHCFLRKDGGKGAVDWTCFDFQKNKNEFIEAIIKHTNYTRIAIYNSFIHCDYKPTASGKREVYSSTPSSAWTLTKVI